MLRVVELEIEGHHSGAHLGLSEDPGEIALGLVFLVRISRDEVFLLGKTGWWFQICFICTPKIGEDVQFWGR